LNHYLFTYVDAVTKTPSTEGPLTHGPEVPQGLTVEFMLESQYPTNTPFGYGSSKEDLERQPGILAKVTAKELKQAKKDEDEAQLNRAKTEAKVGLNFQRNLTNEEPLEFQGHLFDVDFDSLQVLSSAVSLAHLRLLDKDETKFRWKTADNAVVELSPRELLELHGAYFLRANEVHQQTSSQKNRISSCKSIKDIYDA